jgi:hypothetical protein
MTTRLLRALLAPDTDARCATALAMYFYRHPHVYVTTDRLAAQVGYGVERVESSIETLVRAGMIVRQSHPSLNAVMYRVAPLLWQSGLPPTAFMIRWRRQIGLLRDAHDRCRRAALHAARASERIRQAEQLMAMRLPKNSLARDG